MAKAPVQKAVLKDYFSDKLPQSVLLDYEGEPQGQGVAYRIGNKLVQTNNNIVGAITGLPGQFRDNWKLLKDPTQRRLLARALVDDNMLTQRRRQAIFSIFIWTMLIIWGIVGIVFATAFRDDIGTYQGLFGVFFYSLLTSLMLPTPFEFILSGAADEIGIWITVAIASVAKCLGAWLVLMMGDKANEGLTLMLEKRASLRKGFEALQNFAHKYGYGAMFLFFVIPFSPDTAPLFILATMKMKKLPFLIVMFIAIVTRSLIFIFAWDSIKAWF